MFRSLNLKAFLVGGACRDKIMGIQPKDLDFSVEATYEEFRAVFNEEEAPYIGKQFPVFMLNKNEVALTRSEVSTGHGEKDFEIVETGVMIEDDLSRRDFSCNSIACYYTMMDNDNFKGYCIDPFGGIQDIENKILRTVNPLYVQQSPIRIYRMARFTAILGFTIEEETAEIARRDKEFLRYAEKHVVFNELRKMYERSDKPSVFFRVLQEVDCLKEHFEPLHNLTAIYAGPSHSCHGEMTAFDHTMECIDKCKAFGYSFDVFIAVLFMKIGLAKK